MKNTGFFFTLAFAFTASALYAQSFIHIDQFGYHPEGEKVAVISDPKFGFNADDSFNPDGLLELRFADTHTSIFTIPVFAWENGDVHGQSGDIGWWADFSSFRFAGTYYLFDSGSNTASDTFRIEERVYRNVLQAAMKMFYYNRCNHDKAVPYADDRWTDGDNFRNPLQDENCRFYLDPNNASLEKELSGGWFDAGDYNKYVNYAMYAVEDLLSAYEENPLTFRGNWGIPESSNKIPDILDEIKYELDWVYKMSNEDGSVHMKMGSISFSENAGSPPSVNTDPRYYGNTCTSSSLATALMFSHAAKVFYSIDENDYADKLKARAIDCFMYATPFMDNGNLETDCDDVVINASDSDETEEAQMSTAIAASVHLYELTDDEFYHDFFKSNYSSSEPIATTFWSPYTMHLNSALLHYTTLPTKDENVSYNILETAKSHLSNDGNEFFKFTDSDLYRASVPDWMYHWGSNKAKAHVGNLANLFRIHDIIPSENENLKRKSTEMIHYFHGVNPLGIVYLSNMYDHGAARCANEIYHTWFNDGTIYDNALTSPSGPAPGYLAGGPNTSFSVPSISPPADQPAQKAYLDWNDGFPSNSWEITEPSITYQAAYVRLLSSVEEQRLATNTSEINNRISQVKVYPNPASEVCHIAFHKSSKDAVQIQLLDLNGKVVVQHAHNADVGENLIQFDLDKNLSGVYFIKLIMDDKIHVQKLLVQK